MKVKGSTLHTKIDVRLFLTGLMIIFAVVAVFTGTAVVSHFIMVRKRRANYALGMRIADVARMAKTDTSDIHCETLFLKLHSDFPHLRVSGENLSCGKGSVEDVLLAHGVQH